MKFVIQEADSTMFLSLDPNQLGVVYFGQLKDASVFTADSFELPYLIKSLAAQGVTIRLIEFPKQ